MKSILELRKANAKKRNMASRENSLLKYEECQEKIKKLLKQIDASLLVHDRRASGQGGHHWGHVGDLKKIETQLQDIRDSLIGQGEYAR